MQGENLHSLWDNLLGRSHKPNDVKRTVAKLAAERFRPAKVDGDVEDWIVESHELAKSFAYSPEIIAAVRADGELNPINLPREYLTSAGSRARQRIVAAGLRAGTLINSLKAPPKTEQTTPAAADLAFGMDSPKRAATKEPPSVSTEKTHWLNLSGNVRHNPSCRWYQNTKRGRMCRADEGKACGQCGG